MLGYHLDASFDISFGYEAYSAMTPGSNSMPYTKK